MGEGARAASVDLSGCAIISLWLGVRVSEALAREVVERLTARGLTLATAESSVGGMIGHWLTDVPGASRVLVGGVIAYGRGPKVDLLHVPPDILDNHGSVSEPAVREMAEGVRDAIGADIGLAETGVAGPSDNPGRPQGLFYVALVGPGLERVERHLFEGDREALKRQATEAALRLALAYLDETGLGETGGGAGR